MQDVVFSRQRVGADVVFAFQFPVPVEDQGGGGKTGSWVSRYAKPEKKRKPEAEAAEVLAEVQRAVEIADAAVARASQPSKALKDLQASLRALLKPPEPVAPLEEDTGNVRFPAADVRFFAGNVRVSAGPSPALLDEDAILAASILMMRRRRKG